MAVYCGIKVQKQAAVFKPIMRHPKISIASSAVITCILASFTVLFISFNNLGSYIVAFGFLLLTFYWVHRLYTKLWLYNGGKPLSEEKKRKREQLRRQGEDYRRYNLYRRLYLFADSTKNEYEVEKAKERLKKLRRK